MTVPVYILYINMYIYLYFFFKYLQIELDSIFQGTQFIQFCEVSLRKTIQNHKCKNIYEKISI